MKLKPFLLIYAIICFFILKSSAQTILVQNTEHVIYYTISGENIIFTIEDVNDKQNDLECNESYGAGSYRYINDDLCSEKAITFDDSHDASCIEVDINNNGKLETEDLGYIQSYLYNGRNDCKTVYKQFLYSSFQSLGFNRFSSFSYTRNDNSKATGNAKWSTSKNCAESHPIWTYCIPIKEMINLKEMKISLRFLVQRRGGNSYAKPKIYPKITDTYYFYPVGQTGDYNSPKFYSIDLKNSTETAVIKLKKEYDDAIAQKKQVNSDANLLRKLYTKEAMKKALTSLPKYDNAFVKLKNGKYIELHKQKYHRAILGKNNSTYGDVMESRKYPMPFYVESEFDTLRFIQIKKNDFTGIAVVAGNALKGVVDYMKFLYPVRKYPLLPLSGASYYLAEWDNVKNDVTGKKIEGVNMYWFDKGINLSRTLGESWSYNYTFNNSLDAGFYGLWMGTNIWLFEILPDVESNSITDVHYIGEDYGGGKVFYITDNGKHGLIVAKEDQSTNSIWGCPRVNVSGLSNGVGSGSTNTSLIVNSCNSINLAAAVCDKLVLNGFSDWYLPSLEELQLLYDQKGKVGILSSHHYWSSSLNSFNTEFNSSYGWEIDFSNGNRKGILYNTTYYVRAIRTF